MTKLPDTFWVRKRGRAQTNYVAVRKDGDDPDLYEIRRPGLPETQSWVGVMRIVPTEKFRKDGRGFSCRVALGKGMKDADAYWAGPKRPIVEGAVVGQVTASRGLTEEGDPAVKLMFWYDDRTAHVLVLPSRVAKLLLADLMVLFPRR